VRFQMGQAFGKTSSSPVGTVCTFVCGSSSWSQLVAQT
jgi:hypothetical protein